MKHCQSVDLFVLLILEVIKCRFTGMVIAFGIHFIRQLNRYYIVSYNHKVFYNLAFTEAEYS